MERGEHYAIGSLPGNRWFVELVAFGVGTRIQVNPINENGTVIGKPFWTQESLITGTLREELQYRRRRAALSAEPPLHERVGAAFRGIATDTGSNVFPDLGDYVQEALSKGRQHVTLTKVEITAIAARISQLSRGVSL